jgi:hypothetical protein
LPVDPNSTPEEVDAVYREPARFALTKPQTGRHEHESPISLRDRVGEFVDLVDAERGDRRRRLLGPRERDAIARRLEDESVEARRPS